jgi:hypothetical protein
MKKIVAVAFFVSALCTFQNQAKAAGQVSFFGGYLNPGELSVANVRSGLDFHGTALYGARLEHDFLKILGVEQNFAFSPRIFDGTIFPSGAKGADARGFLYSSNLVLNIPLGRFVPFATGGIGLVRPWNIDPNPLGTKFAGNFGGGVKLERLAGPIGLRFDARGWTVPDYFGETLNIFEVSGGVTLTWGKK